jgi:hypothetical protein
MEMRNRLAAVLAAAALGIGAGVGISACGSDDDDSGSDAQSTIEDKAGDATDEAKDAVGGE